MINGEVQNEIDSTLFSSHNPQEKNGSRNHYLKNIFNFTTVRLTTQYYQ